MHYPTKRNKRACARHETKWQHTACVSPTLSVGEEGDRGAGLRAAKGYTQVPGGKLAAANLFRRIFHQNVFAGAKELDVGTTSKLYDSHKAVAVVASLSS